VLQTNKSSSFQGVMEIVEGLPAEEQEMLVEIIRHRLVELKRLELITEVKEARAAYQHGDVKRGDASDVNLQREEF